MPAQTWECDIQPGQLDSGRPSWVEVELLTRNCWIHAMDQRALVISQTRGFLDLHWYGWFGFLSGVFHLPSIRTPRPSDPSNHPSCTCDHCHGMCNEAMDKIRKLRGANTNPLWQRELILEASNEHATEIRARVYQCQ